MVVVLFIVPVIVIPAEAEEILIELPVIIPVRVTGLLFIEVTTETLLPLWDTTAETMVVLPPETGKEMVQLPGTRWAIVGVAVKKVAAVGVTAMFRLQPTNRAAKITRTELPRICKRPIVPPWLTRDSVTRKSLII